MYAAIGVLLGTFVGVLPGIGPAMAVALLLPVTYSLEPTSAFIMFAGIYYGGMYGGSTTSILLNTPGESASVMTALEGNKMAKAGRAAQALATAAIGSFIAGTIGTLLVAFFAPMLAELAVDDRRAVVLRDHAVRPGPDRPRVLGSSKVRGFLALFLGLTIGLVGLDLNTGQARLSLGCSQLRDPLEIVVVAVGIFALGEAFWVAAHLRRKPLQVIPVGPAVDGPRRLAALLEPVAARHRAGLPVRRDPGRRRRDPDVPVLHHRAQAGSAEQPTSEFGKGAIEGVAGPEAANNASAAGMFVPLLALGIPVTATASVMLAALHHLRHPARARS